jgi:sigma-54 specific flagellar transcriptional regulator A
MALPAASAASTPPGGASSGLVHGPRSPLVETKRTCLRIAASDATVLLTGETGTGKEVFARLIHSGSPRVSRPFVPVNCGAIPEALLESELFGYVKGAFTGAVSARRGRVALAEGGTLFLDEIGELPLSLQVKLLRLLQERTYEPIGSSDSLPANFRLVAATNRDLAEEVRLGRFRSDLYYRLHVCPLRLPPLRERRGDIEPLFQFFWNRRGELRPVEPVVIQCLEAYGWPGNVRELENLVERVSVCAEGDVIRMADLPLSIRAPHLATMETDANLGALTLQLGLAAPDGGSIFAEPPATGTTVAGTTVAGVAMPGGPPSSSPPSVDSPSMDSPSVSSRSIDAPSTGSPSINSSSSSSASSPASSPSLSDMATQLRARALGLDAAEGPSPSDTTRYEGVRLKPHGNTPTPIMQFPVDLPTMLRELENRYINAALTRTGSNKKEAAKLLGMGRTTLVEKLRRRSTD